MQRHDFSSGSFECGAVGKDTDENKKDIKRAFGQDLCDALE